MLADASRWGVGLITPYTMLVGTGLLVSALWWSRLVKRQGGDRRLPVVYACGLLGALVGAKAAFLLAEGWAFRGDTVALLTGKSITGALLLGYAGVELGKRLLGYHRVTGDLFSLVVPAGIALGRVGCIVQGCCPGRACSTAWWTVTDHGGISRWPAAHAELAFNLIFLVWAAAAARIGWLRGNRFHVYLIAYGLFRFTHEFLRDDARVAGPVSVYHVLAGMLVVLGVWRFIARLRQAHAEATLDVA